jgi:hypothetical protein
MDKHEEYKEKIRHAVQRNMDKLEDKINEELSEIIVWELPESEDYEEWLEFARQVFFEG